mgnify:CR=1 FL=1
MNPNGDEHLQSPYASLGHPKLNWAYSRMNNPNSPWEDDKDTYYDTYGFSTVHPIVKKHYGKFLDCVDFWVYGLISHILEPFMHQLVIGTSIVQSSK